MRRPDPALLVVLGGVSAALHVGKLAPAIPVLQQALGIGLVEAGFLLSLVQLAGMALGLVVGLAADGLGLRRTMVTGLAVLCVASALGATATSAPALMVLRAIEGLGFLLASMPAPSLIRLLVKPERMSRMLGLWGAYMPFGTACALLAGPLLIASIGWQGWWLVLSAISAVMGMWLWIALPPDPTRAAASHARSEWSDRLARTLRAPGPWLVALCFSVYSAQWLAVIGFLPSVYARAGLSPALAGVATALAAAVNMSGNIASGRLLHAGIRAQALLYIGFAAMGLGGFFTFSDAAAILDPQRGAFWRYAAVLVFSSVGGLIPGTLFSLAVQLAPDEHTVSTSVGWLQQWSAAGQLAGPPLVAWVATRTGGWEWSWLVTSSCALAGLLLSTLVGRLLEPRAPL